MADPRRRWTVGIGDVTMAVLIMLALDPRDIAEAWHVPVAPFVAVAVLVLAAMRAFRRRAPPVAGAFA